MIDRAPAIAPLSRYFYTLLSSFIGANGWPLELSLCPGVQHSAKDTEDDLHRVIPMARRVSAAGPKAPLPVRLDSGFDWAALMVLRSNIPIGALLQMPERTPRMTSSKFRA